MSLASQASASDLEEVAKSYGEHVERETQKLRARSLDVSTCLDKVRSDNNAPGHLDTCLQLIKQSLDETIEEASTTYTDQLRERGLYDLNLADLTPRKCELPNPPSGLKPEIWTSPSGAKASDTAELCKDFIHAGGYGDSDQSVLVSMVEALEMLANFLGGGHDYPKSARDIFKQLAWHANDMMATVEGLSNEEREEFTRLLDLAVGACGSVDGLGIDYQSPEGSYYETESDFGIRYDSAVEAEDHRSDVQRVISDDEESLAWSDGDVFHSPITAEYLNDRI